MRTVTSELMVCGVSPESDRDTPADNDPNRILNTEDRSPSGIFTLGLLADASISLQREENVLETSDEEESELPTHSIPRERRHALDTSTSETTKALLAIPPQTSSAQPVDARTPHGPAHQPATEKLLKTLPSSVRSRAESLHEPRPLPFRYTLSPTRRFRIGDAEAFAALQQKNIEWYVTTGLLVEDYTGLRWNAGTYKYLLYWHVEGMPTPDGVDIGCTGEKYLSIEPRFVREWQKGKWESVFGDEVMELEDEDATPIVEVDTLLLPLGPAPHSKVTSRPPTPSRERVLLPGSKSALKGSQRRPGSPALSVRSDPGSASSSGRGEKRVRLLREKRRRILVWDVDEGDEEEGGLVEKEGRFVERVVDEVGDLSDNEGRTARRWMGVN